MHQSGGGISSNRENWEPRENIGFWNWHSLWNIKRPYAYLRDYICMDGCGELLACSYTLSYQAAGQLWYENWNRDIVTLCVFTITVPSAGLINTALSSWLVQLPDTQTSLYNIQLAQTVSSCMHHPAWALLLSCSSQFPQWLLQQLYTDTEWIASHCSGNKLLLWQQHSQYIISYFIFHST